jgi:hypothetical protein
LYSFGSVHAFCHILFSIPDLIHSRPITILLYIAIPQTS